MTDTRLEPAPERVKDAEVTIVVVDDDTIEVRSGVKVLGLSPA